MLLTDGAGHGVPARLSVYEDGDSFLCAEFPVCPRRDERPWAAVGTVGESRSRGTGCWLGSHEMLSLLRLETQNDILTVSGNEIAHVLIGDLCRCGTIPDHS